MATSKSSKVWLFKGVPLDNTYINTIKFSNQSAQNTYFANREHITFSDQSYQRINQNTIRLAVSSDTVYDYNYMMIQNPSSGNFKWFYCFINQINYVNDNACEIIYEVDVLQTWLFDFSYGECYVEREHVTDDTVGAHTVNENLATGEYVVSSVLHETDSPAVQVVYSQDNTLSASFVNNCYVPLNRQTGDGSLSGVLSISSLLDNYKDKPEQIACVQMITRNMMSGSFMQNFSFARPTLFNFKGDNYIPQNNKLFTYPYTFMTIDNFSGSCETYKFEDFADNNNATFYWRGISTPSPQMQCYPYNYKGLASASQYGVSYDDFPQCPYIIDTFRAWVSATQGKVLNNTTAQIINTVVSSVTTLGQGAISTASSGNPSTIASAGLSAVSGAVTSGVNIWNQKANYNVDYEYNKIYSKSIGGSVATSGFNFSAGQIGFRATSYTIRPEYARIIDEYFTRYGYKVNRNKVPNLSPKGNFKWNYVKTSSCNVLGNIPSNVRQKIEDITNNGITYWHTTNVGYYGAG